MQELDCRWRVLVTGLAPAEWNMALDEALLEDGGVPTLRLYGWEPECVSLGYFQPSIALEERIGEVHRVRRSTGGGAIYHGRDLTYSVTLPGRVPSETLYRFVHGRIGEALKRLGLDGAEEAEEAGPEADPPGDGERPFFCFDRLSYSFDLTVGGRKLVGSAQRRRRQRMLQHGTIPLRPDPFSSRGTSLEEQLGDGAPSWAQLAGALRAVWPRGRAGSLETPVRERAARLQQRFESEGWLLRDRGSSCVVH